ncbi:L-ribulokinase [Angomonas deanei]|uniref:FGGY family of carbohydrate kinases, N-terminal domain/FGGY family of carbohydrate kinases, C-terminal domain containing protein, putative n=1 Tax=Angomonas deanei TaxID=59799 RepID=S9VM85_9TRYP|nr:L-ribulokinase [Angomonas deanei]EPY41861.1 L-ribulokinase [Angomonas deanei]EPY41969.1 L-ribulokinase [Angomonas deanei]CAD2214732.1 FGGY family of carbohydrate kinases, N-terminal domain/FGGY family of carbohydrate kinases, C-terminal domain containing protein, putative [Angomonas deanei]|eukprot:EPY27074.1 L-ribulokinase [Angomonas deanei]
MSASPLVIGLDYGSDSARAVLIRVCDGKELKSAVLNYPRWAQGKYCDPSKDQYRQHPLDYLEAAESIINGVTKGLSAEQRSAIVGLAFDTTGSTPCLVDEHCTPLCMRKEFADNPNAMFILWKDHTSVQEASDINKLAHSNTPDYTAFSGKTYSSEWFWSKALHVIRNDETVANAAHSIVECSEWLPAQFTGVSSYKNLTRSRCACGHKAMWHESWGGFPPESFFAKLHPTLALYRSRMSDTTETADRPVGKLSPEWARRLGLGEHVVVAGGAIDAHFGAVGAGIKPFSFVRVMGTSTCDMMVIDSKVLNDHCVKGICGQVDGSILPGMVGMEAGQSAYGDIFAWFSRLLLDTSIKLIARSSSGNLGASEKAALEKEMRREVLRMLSDEAARVDPSKSSVYALDWFNGRRTPDANQRLRGVVQGLTLGSDAPTIYRALVEATAFGSRAIVERFREEGVRIENVIAVGGIAKKSPLAIQVLADVLNMTISVCQSDQVCAVGAAIVAATAAGCYESVSAAQEKMASGISNRYEPDKARASVYEELYKRYTDLAKASEKMYSHM